MTRVVVHVRWRPELDPDVSEEQREQQWAELLAPLFERAGALGGRIVGWAQRELVVDFSWDGLYDAVDFLVDAPLAPELASGMSCGAMRTVVEMGRSAIVLGEAIHEANELVQLARPGEVLLTPSLVEMAAGQLGTLGEVGARPGRPQVEALILDPENPFQEADSESPKSEEGFVLVPAELRRSPSSRAPASVVERQVARLASTAEAVGEGELDVFPPEISTALRKRDAASLQELARSARLQHSLEAADRLDAIAELAGGKSGEALRRLRSAKEKLPEGDSTAGCRASLALAVALLSAGRTYEAALEGLDGVAFAREGNDERGERACARFLSQVAEQLGDRAAAQAWAGLVQD